MLRLDSMDSWTFFYSDLDSGIVDKLIIYSFLLPVYFLPGKKGADVGQESPQKYCT